MHFLGNIRFYDEIILGGEDVCNAANESHIYDMCATLFMLSGYLMSKIKLDNNYYVKRIRVIIIYVLASIVCEIFRIVFLQEEKILLILLWK